MPTGNRDSDRDETQQPILPVGKYLDGVMRSEANAAFESFKRVWKSSHSLRLAIGQFVRREQAQPLGAPSPTPDAKPSDTSIHSTVTPYKRSLPTESLASHTNIAKKLAESFGGLGLKDILLLLEKHKAGKRDLGTYLLVRAWKKSSGQLPSCDCRITNLTLETVEQAIRENRSDFFREIAYTIDFLQQEEYEVNNAWDHDPSQWWQFHLLLYILEHPKEKYPIREFIKHFRDEVGTNEMPTTKTIRKFCRDNGISLDSRPGAPKKSPN